MNRLELIRQVAGETGLSPAAADAAVRAALDAVTGALARGEAVRLSGFGAFAAKDRPAHAGQAPGVFDREVLDNADPRPFRWTKSAADILATIKRFCLRTLETAERQRKIIKTSESGH